MRQCCSSTIRSAQSSVCIPRPRMKWSAPCQVQEAVKFVIIPAVSRFGRPPSYESSGAGHCLMVGRPVGRPRRRERMGVAGGNRREADKDVAEHWMGQKSLRRFEILRQVIGRGVMGYNRCRFGRRKISCSSVAWKSVRNHTEDPLKCHIPRPGFWRTARHSIFNFSSNYK